MSVGLFVQFFDYALTAVVIVLTFTSWALVWHFRRNPIVAEAQPLLLSLLCGGVTMMIIGQVFFNVLAFPEKNYDPRKATQGAIFCGMGDWFGLMGRLTVATILFSKLYCVATVTKFRQRHSIKVHHVILIGLFVIAVAMVAQAVLHLLVPPDYAFLEFQDETVGLGFCRPIGSRSHSGYILGQALIDLPLQMTILVLSWNLRNESHDLRDSRRIFRLTSFHIGIAVSTWVVYGVIFHANLLGFDETGRWFVYAIVQPTSWFLYTTSSVLALILPRLMTVWYESVHERLPETVQQVAERKILGRLPEDSPMTSKSETSSKPKSSRTAATAPSSVRSLATLASTTPPTSARSMVSEISNSEMDARDKAPKRKKSRPAIKAKHSKPGRLKKCPKTEANSKPKTSKKQNDARTNSPRNPTNSKPKASIPTSVKSTRSKEKFPARMSVDMTGLSSEI